MGKKFFTPTGRVNDIIGMAINHGEVFTIQKIMDDYEIKRSSAYRTLETLKTFDYITVQVEGEQIKIELKKFENNFNQK